jgi:hypothetical protein
MVCEEEEEEEDEEGKKEKEIFVKLRTSPRFPPRNSARYNVSRAHGKSSGATNC